MYIYVDVVLLINFIMNGLLLWATARLTGTSYQYWRILSGAALGAVYIVALLFIPELQQLYIKFLVSLLMILTAFAPVSFRHFLSLFGYFYLTALLAGGAAMGLFYLTEDIIWDLSERIGDWWPITAVVAVIVLISRFGWGLIQNKLWTESVVAVEVHHQDKVLQFRALVDTGNRLRDPLTDDPVIIVEYDVLRRILPGAEKAETGEDWKQMFLDQPDTISGNRRFRVRIIPFSSLGTRRGLLCGFRPEQITVYRNDFRIELQRGIIGICEQKLSEEGRYSALINPESFGMVGTGVMENTGGVQGGATDKQL